MSGYRPAFDDPSSDGDAGEFGRTVTRGFAWGFGSGLGRALAYALTALLRGRR